jgi:hypothetical protein
MGRIAILYLLLFVPLQAVYALTPDGKLTQDAKRALIQLRIRPAEVADTERRPLGLERSLRLLISLVRLQAADYPARGPLPQFSNFAELVHVLQNDRLKNANLPRMRLADLPQPLVAALRAAKVMPELPREITPIQLFAWFLYRERGEFRVVALLQREMRRPARHRFGEKSTEVWRKLDAVSENLALSYYEALTRPGNPSVPHPSGA